MGAGSPTRDGGGQTRKATLVERPVKESLFLAAADLFGASLEDPKLAFEVTRRAIAECSDDPAVLRRAAERTKDAVS